MVTTFPALLIYGADLSDFSVGISVAVLGATAIAVGRWLARRAAKLALEQFTEAINHIVDVQVTPQFVDMHRQIVTLQDTFDEEVVAAAKQRASVVDRLEAVEARLPAPAPPNYPPPPR